MIIKASKVIEAFIKGEHASCINIDEGMNHVQAEYTNNNDDRIRITYEVVQDLVKRTCLKCDGVIIKGWAYCAHCGRKLPKEEV